MSEKASSLIQAVIFDMDGLLVDSEPLWRQAELKVFGKLGLQLSQKDLHDTTGIRLDEVVKIRYAQKPWTGMSLSEVEEAIMDLLVQYIGTSAELLSGVEQLMTGLEQRNVPFAIASSSPKRVIDAMVNKFNWVERIPILQSAESLSFGKPHPEVYLRTAEKMKVSPKSCLAFEDSVPGVIAAKAANMLVVAVPDPEFRDHTAFGVADQVLDSLLDFQFDRWI